MTFDATVVTVSCEWSIGYFARSSFAIIFSMLDIVVVVLLCTDSFVMIIIIIILMLLTVTATVVLVRCIFFQSTCHFSLELLVDQTDELLELSVRPR